MTPEVGVNTTLKLTKEGTNKERVVEVIRNLKYD